jgi:hypothetical protein
MRVPVRNQSKAVVEVVAKETLRRAGRDGMRGQEQQQQQQQQQQERQQQEEEQERENLLLVS